MINQPLKIIVIFFGCLFILGNITLHSTEESQTQDEWVTFKVTQKSKKVFKAGKKVLNSLEYFINNDKTKKKSYVEGYRCLIQATEWSRNPLRVNIKSLNDVYVTIVRIKIIPLPDKSTEVHLNVLSQVEDWRAPEKRMFAVQDMSDERVLITFARWPDESIMMNDVILIKQAIEKKIGRRYEIEKKIRTTMEKLLQE